MVPAQRVSSAFGRRTARATTFSFSPTKREASRSPTLHTLRQQLARREGRANVALADFVAPRASGLADYIGAFAVTAGIGEEAASSASSTPTTTIPRSWPRRLPTGSPKPLPSICTHASAASSGAMRQDEALANAELIAEDYRGIRPAPGYPAQPDHTEKATMFKLLDAAEATGIKLTESFAMYPARIRFRPVPRAPGKPLFRRWQDRPRPG